MGGVLGFDASPAANPVALTGLADLPGLPATQFAAGLLSAADALAALNFLGAADDALSHVLDAAFIARFAAMGASAQRRIRALLGAPSQEALAGKLDAVPMVTLATLLGFDYEVSGTANSVTLAPKEDYPTGFGFRMGQATGTAPVVFGQNGQPPPFPRAMLGVVGNILTPAANAIYSFSGENFAPTGFTPNPCKYTANGFSVPNENFGYLAWGF